MTNIVFVHGAWHGGWCWQKVTALMNPIDFHIYTPSLTGSGDRAHLRKYLDPLYIDLDLHIQDIVQLMTYENLWDVVLVGHAYAGMVITGIADICPERLSNLVYINGVVPRDGESMLDQLEAVRSPAFSEWIRNHLIDGDGFLPAPASHEEVERRWGITNKADLEWVFSNITPHPSASFSQKISIKTGFRDGLSISFVGSSESGFESVIEKVRLLNWDMHHIESGHDPMITNPEEVANILLNIVRSNSNSLGNSE